jgi:UDP-N-acetylmuramoyl-tripeptide--D-alanyl-D-alanine ligase
MLSAANPVSNISQGRDSREPTSSWTLNQILLATNGRILPFPIERFRRPAHPDDLAALPRLSFTNISTDTRTLARGDLFVTLRGDNFDGVDFIPQALQKGASGLLISKDRRDDVCAMLKQPDLAGFEQPLVILVSNPLTALGDLAANHRSLLPNLRVIAITGSTGKTTVKEMTAAIISKRFSTLKTKGNFNNLIGLPLTLLEAQDQHRMAVLEMGMNHPGEIARLTEIADPDVGLILNIHHAHLEGLNSIEGVAQAKGELFDGMKSWSTLVVNYDDPLVRALAKQYRRKKIGFAASAAGRRHRPVVGATHIKGKGSEGIDFRLRIGEETQCVNLRTIGSHNVNNALAAAALAHAVGIGIETIAEGLASFTAFEKRSQLLETPLLGLRIYNDAYNANPASMQAAITTLASLGRGHRTIAVLGDMLELGDYSLAAHRNIGRMVEAAGIDYLAVFGEFGPEMVAAAREAGMADKQAQAFDSKNELSRWLQELVASGALNPGDLLLLKGSRGMRMETILEDLQKETA